MTGGYAATYASTYPEQASWIGSFSPQILKPVLSPIENGLTPISTVAVVEWNVDTTISSLIPVSWNIPSQRISSSVSCHFNINKRISVIGSFTVYNIDRPVVSAIDSDYYIPQISWDINSRIKCFSNKIDWNIRKRSSSYWRLSWNSRIIDHTEISYNWNVLKRIYKPGVQIATWVNQVDEPVIHPVSYLSSRITPSSEWNTLQRYKTSQIIRFNTRITDSSSHHIAFNTLGLSVTSTKQISWMLSSRIHSYKSSYWKLYSRLSLKKKISWSDNNSVSIMKAISWRLTDHVSITQQIKWNLYSRRISKKIIRWNDTARQKSQDKISWNTLSRIHLINWQLVFSSPGNISSFIVHPIDTRMQAILSKGLLETVLQPISYSYYPALVRIPQPGIQWRLGINPNGRVSASAAISFRDLIIVNSDKKIYWKTIQRISSSQKALFNIYNSIEQDIIIQWITGAGISGHIRQTSQIRTDFAY